MIDLPGAWNARDVAHHIPAIQPGYLFRASELTALTPEGHRSLTHLGITDIIDLRTSQEHTHHGEDTVPHTIHVHSLSLTNTATSTALSTNQEGIFETLIKHTDASSLKDAAYQYMINAYHHFPTHPGTATTLRALIVMLIRKKSILVHCLAGKDRTGFIIALLLRALDIPHNDILADYLASNQSIMILREKIIRVLQHYPHIPEELYTFLYSADSDVALGVRPEYLHAAWESLITHYGSLSHYLTHAQIDSDHLQQLRTVLCRHL